MTWRFLGLLGVMTMWSAPALANVADPVVADAGADGGAHDAGAGAAVDAGADAGADCVDGAVVGSSCVDEPPTCCGFQIAPTGAHSGVALCVLGIAAALVTRRRRR